MEEGRTNKGVHGYSTKQETVEWIGGYKVIWLFSSIILKAFRKEKNAIY